MVNENLKRMLEISKKVDEQVSSGNVSRPIQRKTNLEEQLKNYDEQVYGQYVPSKEEQKQYSAEAEMKLIKERVNNTNGGYNHNTRVPNKIVESILSNPCDLDANMYEDNNMTEFTKRLSKRITGIKNVQDIQKRLEESDRQSQANRTVEQRQQNGGNGNSTVVDYSLIKTIVESVINEKMDSLKKELLDEGISHNGNTGNLKAMKMGDKFLFLDDNNNVYECQMKYVGKNKKK